MKYDVIVVGGGIAGLTSAAYLSKYGYKVLVCEKEKKVGGLVNSFNFKGFTFDGGIRALENSGILMPMLRQLGLDVDFMKNDVSIGIEDKVIKLLSRESLEEYKVLLCNKFKGNIDDIEKIIEEIKKITKYMDILYGIDNPLFLDMKNDREYLCKKILPWMFKYIMTIKKITKLNIPVEEYLKRFTKNEELIDIIIQHFFKDTPTFFALSYFGLYLDYKYPKGGTGALIDKMRKFIIDNKGEFKTETEICNVSIQSKKLKDVKGKEYYYDKLIWATDLRRLYDSIDLASIIDPRVKEKVSEKKAELIGKNGGDSILTLYITVNLDKGYFENICKEHSFYTPSSKGLNNLNIEEMPIVPYDKEDIINWMKKYYELTTYEISIPVMRDNSLAPKGKTGLIISTLMDYSLVKYVYENGWYDEFKIISEECIIKVLNKSIFPNLESKVIDKFMSTPLTIEKVTGNYQGAITGWAFTNKTIPVENKMKNVARSVNTPIPDVFQAGQWSFSPSGLPIAILTGKLAADKINIK